MQECQIKPPKVAKNSPFLRFQTGICEWKGAGKRADTRGATRASNSERRFRAALFSRQFRRFDSDCCHCGLTTAHCRLATFCPPRQRDSHLKHRALSQLAKNADCSPVGFGDPFPDRQSQTCASGLARACPVRAEKAPEDMGKVLGGDAFRQVRRRGRTSSALTFCNFRLLFSLPWGSSIRTAIVRIRVL